MQEKSLISAAAELRLPAYHASRCQRRQPIVYRLRGSDQVFYRLGRHIMRRQVRVAPVYEATG